jgi:membrane protease subunit HflK
LVVLANRFRLVLAEYMKAPQVTRDRMYLETIQQVFTNTTKVLVDVKSGSPLLYLPMDKLIQQTAAGAAGAPISVEPSGVGAPRVPAGDTGVPAAAEARSRDALRGRDREVR